MWHNKYIGIPYQEKGRTLEGADCWGLSRLIYKNEFDIDLPSFSDNYAHEDTERIAELIIQYREGWENTNEPKSGDMVLFRVLGHISHIGVMINDKQFIHSRQGQDAAIDNLSNSRWTHRVAGIYTYSENSKEVMLTKPTAFSAIHASFTPGMNLGEILKQVIEDNKIPLSMESQVMIFIDGEAVTSITDKNLIPQEDQLIEYRLVPGKDALKIVLIIAVAIYAPQIAASMLQAGTAAGIGGLGSWAVTAGGAIFVPAAGAMFAATAVISLIGMTLVNAIFPVRPPEAIPDAGSSNPQLMFNGARNTANQYQPIPVVLGQYRIVAPCAAVNYLTVNTDTAFLKMLLTWGYGPVDVTDMRVGATLLSDYKLADGTALPDLKSVYGLSTETEADLAAIYQVYGPDTYQISPNIELINPGTTSATAEWQTYNIASLVNNVSVSIHFPEGLRGICREGDNAGAPFATAFTGEIQFIEISQNTLAEIGSWTTIPLAYGAAPTYSQVSTPTTYYVNDDLVQGYTIVSVSNNDSQPFYMRKDAFTVTVNLNITSTTPKFYKVKIRRNNRQGTAYALELDSASGKPVLYHKAIVYLITGTNSTKKATSNPTNTKLALTAINIQATDQLNGSIDGINALVTSRCLDYDSVSNTWIEKPTRNPASLFRYILQHPANAQRIAAVDAATKIDLDYLKTWWIRCNTNGYTYDAVVSSQKSVLDTLKDICAAGRASPLLLGGKWTVVEDIPRTTVVQHFAPHNSWGFEGSKKLSVMPHALRITFINSEKEYQSEELMVYNDGYDATNSSIFEAIQLPGITTATLVHKHGRFHLAQAKLRPEIYTLNTDMEFMVCNRGDLVRVSHDIPMWGSGTGRIRNYISSTVLELDEPISLAAALNYVIRIRTETGETVLANIVGTGSDRINATTITLSTAITAIQGKAGNLFMIGQSNLESAELIVLTIEPSANLTAKLTLVDYSPGIYTADSQAIPAFTTKITLPSLFARDYITNVPVVTTADIRSDESVMELSGSNYIYKLSIPYTNPINLNTNITHVEARLCMTNDASSSWRTSQKVLLSAGSFLFTDMVESEAYSIQLRYLSGSGFVGPWSTIINNILIVGRSNPPASVSSIITIVPESDKLRITWPKNSEIDLVGYEVREIEGNWGTSTNVLFIGNSNTCLVTPGPVNTAKYWYIKAYDSAKLYSANSTNKSYTVLPPSTPTNITASYTGTTALFKWTAALPGSFSIRNYRLTLTGVGLSTITATADTTEWEIPVTWINAVTLTIVPIDILNNEYTGTSNTIVLPISVPSIPSNPVQSISGTDLILDWDDNTLSSSQLTLLGYEIYNNDNTLAWKGLVSKANISMIGLSGTKTYTLYARDYKNQLSAARNISYVIDMPTNISNSTTLTATFGTSLTDASLTLNWASVSSSFGTASYEVSYDTTSIIVNSNTITLSPLPSNWIGDKIFTIKTIDLLGNKSSGITKTVTKSKPNIVVGITADVIDNNVMLYWTLPIRTTLPIDHVIVRKTKINGIALASAINVGEKSGTFTTIFEREANTYTYEIAAVDTDKQEGTAYPLTVTVSQPPDFIFNGSFTSKFSNQTTPGISTVSSSNAKIEINLDTGINQVTMPLDTVSTVSQHFDTRGWSTPQNQIDAAYPIYSQPSIASGYYEEIIDFGTIIGSSQVTLTFTGTTIAGTPIVTSNMSYSADNVTYSAVSTSTLLFITNFRYLKVNIAVSQISSDKAVYALNYLNIRLDSKIKDDAGGVSCVSTHTAGTLVNFNREFIDVTSIVVSPNSTVPLIPVYAYKDAVVSATYTISSNICTITTSTAHEFSSAVGASGQKVRLEFTSGTGISGIYTITSIPSTTQYTVAIVTANTSGNVSTYSQGIRVYLYDTTGTRVSGPASWAIKGY